jgi:tetratricopeptide (TPR) repeat protein
MRPKAAVAARTPGRRGRAVALLSGLLAAAFAGIAQADAGGTAAAASGAPASARAGAPTIGRASALAEARAAVDRGEHRRAIALYAPLLAARPDDADLLIEAARVHGFADRNAEAAALYRRALAAAPGRRADIVPSLAWQTLWAGDAAAALALFGELPASAEVLDGIGQAHQALGQDRAAALAFGRALQAAPQPGAGLRRRAAQALVWAGFDDRAAPLLADATEPDAAWLRDVTIGRGQRRYAYGGIEHAIDRDRLEAWSATLGAGWRPAGLHTAETRLRRLRLTDAAGRVDGTEVQGLLRWRLGGLDAPGGTWWPGVVLRLARLDGWQPLTGLVRTTWVPRDGWRVDAEAGRDIVESPRAVAERVHVDTVSLGADWRPLPSLTTTAALAHLRFDDGNRRDRTLLRAEWRVPLPAVPAWRGARLTLGAEALRFRSARPTGPDVATRGYWNPASYAEHRLTAAWDWNARPWSAGLRLALGEATERDGWGNRTRAHPHGWQLTLAHDVSPGLRLQLSASGSGRSLGIDTGGSSRGAAGGGGYWRRAVSASVIGWF